MTALLSELILHDATAAQSASKLNRAPKIFIFRRIFALHFDVLLRGLLHLQRSFGRHFFNGIRRGRPTQQIGILYAYVPTCRVNHYSTPDESTIGIESTVGKRDDQRRVIEIPWYRYLGHKIRIWKPTITLVRFTLRVNATGKSVLKASRP
jgi:hypothetical protein